VDVGRGRLRRPLNLKRIRGMMKSASPAQHVGQEAHPGDDEGSVAHVIH